MATRIFLSAKLRRLIKPCPRGLIGGAEPEESEAIG